MSRTAETFLPERISLRGLQRAAETCTACPLHREATQTMATVHPSSVLQAGDDRADAEMAFVDDLRTFVRAIGDRA